jgi:hypothetical protein
MKRTSGEGVSMDIYKSEYNQKLVVSRAIEA